VSRPPHGSQRPAGTDSRWAGITGSHSAGITVGVAFGAWQLGWLVGNIASGLVIAASGYGGSDADPPVWAVALGSLVLWAPQIVVLVVVARQFGTAQQRHEPNTWQLTGADDYGARIAPIDLVGIPIGVLTQLVLLRVVYWPLQNLWPGTFSSGNLEENARALWDSARGGWVVVLVATVVVGAPVVEEFVYRGLLQGAVRRRCAEWVGVVGVAALFAAIHFRPVELPGLFVFGAVVGTTVALTGRIGMAILAHMAFNATALALIA